MLIRYRGRHILRRRVIKIIYAAAERPIVCHYESRVDKIEIHRRTPRTAPQTYRHFIARLPIKAQGRREIKLRTICNRLVESIMRETNRDVERHIHLLDPIFKFWHGIHCQIVGIDNIPRQPGHFRRHIGKLRVEFAHISFDTAFKTERQALYRKCVCGIFVGEKSVVAYMLALLASVATTRVRGKDSHSFTL